MNAKRLPKAIRRTAAVSEAAAIPPAQEARAIDPELPDEIPSEAPSSGTERTPERPAATATSLPLPEAPATRRGAEGKRRLANRIVERYATYSIGGGIIPLPFLSAAGVTAINVRMVKALSDLYGVPFQRDRARAVIVGLAAGATPAVLATVAGSALYWLVPMGAIIAVGVSSTTALACTRSIGRVFVEHFESGADQGSERNSMVADR